MATLTVNFTPTVPAPSNGYKLKYRSVVAAGDYTELTVTSSPVVIPNLSGFAYEGTIQANCGGGNLGNSQSFSAVLPLSCGQTRSESYTGLFQYTFPTIPLVLTSASDGSTISLSYNVGVRPNKIIIKNLTDNTNAAATTGTNGWVGQADYSGPWGSSLSTSLTGTLTFTYNNTKTYAVIIECGPTNIAVNPVNDSFSITLACGVTTTSTTTTTTTSGIGTTTTTTTTTAPPAATQFYGLTGCSDNLTYYTTTPITTNGQTVFTSSGSTIYYRYNSSANLFQSNTPSGFIGSVTVTGSFTCPVTYYALTRCPYDAVVYYTSTVLSIQDQRVNKNSVYYIHVPASNLTALSAPSNFIGTVTVDTGLTGCPSGTGGGGGSGTYPTANLSVTCVSGTGSLTVSGYSGGNGTYTRVAYDTTAPNALTKVNSSNPSDYITINNNAHTWTGLPNGNYFVAVRDSSPNAGIANAGSPITINCTTTTTTTTTTTSTTAPPYTSFKVYGTGGGATHYTDNPTFVGFTGCVCDGGIKYEQVGYPTDVTGLDQLTSPSQMASCANEC